MGGFLDWFFDFLTTMIDGVWKIISGIFGGIFQIFNVVNYIKQFGTYKGGFNFLDWFFSILAFLLVMAIWAIIIYMIYLGIRKYIRFRKSNVGNEDLLEEVAELHRDVLRLTKEKEKILALKVGNNTLSFEELNAIFHGEEEESKATKEALEAEEKAKEGRGC